MGHRTDSVAAIRVCGLVGLSVLGMIVGVSQADLIEFTFEGTIEAVGGPVEAPVHVGDAFEFRYWFDSTAADSDPAPNVGSYVGALHPVSLSIGSWTGFAGGAGDIGVLDNGFAGDSYSANLIGPIIAASVGMTNLGGGAFDSDMMPVDLDLGQWDIRQFSVEVEVGPAFWTADGQITGFSSRIVPAPGALLVCVWALAPVSYRRRRGF